MNFIFSSSIFFLLTSIGFSKPCENGVDGEITGQFAGWTCAQLGGLLIGPGQGYCTFDGIKDECCKCVGGGADPTSIPAVTPSPTSLPATPEPTAQPPIPTQDPTNVVTPAPTTLVTQPVAVPTAEPTNAVTSAPTTHVTQPVLTSEPTTQQPITEEPTNSPTSSPSNAVTMEPTAAVTFSPTAAVTSSPIAAVTPQPTEATPPSPTTPSAATDAWNVCYFTNWARYRSGLINEGKDTFEMGFDENLCTHFMYGFATVTQDFDIQSSDPNADHPSGHMAQTSLCPDECNDPSFTVDWSDPSGLRCDWPCNPSRIMRGYEAMNVGMKAKNPAIKTLISVGGWNFNDCNASPADTVGQGSATCEIFSTIAKSEANIRAFAANIISFCRAWGFDGFDLDWEYPVVAGHNNNHKVDGEFQNEMTDYADYITMLRVLKEEFAKENPTHPLLLTAAVGVGKGTVDTAYDIPNMSLYLDQINLMTYDMHGGWESRTGCNAPLYATDEDVAFGGAVGAGVETTGYPLSVSWAVDYWLEHGAKPEQLTVGLGTYGRGWKLANAAENNGYNAPATGKSTPGVSSKEAGYLAYYEIMDLLANNQATRYYDEERQCPYIVTNDGEWIGYDDKISMKAKVDFLKTRNIRGTMFWALDLDDFTGHYSNGEKYPIISFVKNELNGYDPSVTHHSRRLMAN